jgi:hypothetical protein
MTRKLHYRNRLVLVGKDELGLEIRSVLRELFHFSGLAVENWHPGEHLQIEITVQKIDINPGLFSGIHLPGISLMSPKLIHHQYSLFNLVAYCRRNVDRASCCVQSNHFSIVNTKRMSVPSIAYIQIREEGLSPARLKTSWSPSIPKTAYPGSLDTIARVKVPVPHPRSSKCPRETGGIFSISADLTVDSRVVIRTTGS